MPEQQWRLPPRAVVPLLCACHHLLCPPCREPSGTSADFGPKVSFRVLVRMAPAAARPLPWTVLQAGRQHRSAHANSQPAAAAAGLSVGLVDAPSSSISICLLQTPARASRSEVGLLRKVFPHSEYAGRHANTVRSLDQARPPSQMRRWKLLRGGGNSPVAKHAEAAFSGARAACATLQTAAVPTHYLWRTLAPKLPRDLPRGALQAAVAAQIRLQRSLSSCAVR